MTTATVVLVANTTLDVAAARRLADYGGLDDAGVARALEQVHVQRWGRIDLPGHMRRIDAFMAVVDDGTGPRVIRGDQPSERERLQALFAVWPESAAALVDWDGASRALLAARALAHGLVLPNRFDSAYVCGLAERAAPAHADHPAPATEVEFECLRLLADFTPAALEIDICARVLARYRLWLHWQYTTGRINAVVHDDRQARLADLERKETA